MTFDGAFSWARPDSWLAKVFYAKDDMVFARRRFPDVPVPAKKEHH